MAFATINYFSHSLRKASSVNVVFPDSPGAPEPWGVLYLLHGLSDDHSTWARRSCIERYTLGIPLVVVMPDGGRGWYTNAVAGDAYEDDLLEDVFKLVERNFPIRAERAGRAIGGLSMGGYGAVKLGLKHPNLFASVHSHSGVLAITRTIRESKDLVPEFTRIFGEHPKDGPEDPFALAAKANPRKLPAFRLDCGLDDPFLHHNREFHRHLESLGIDHEYEEKPGTHTWRYWDAEIQRAIPFHAKNLDITMAPEHELLR